MNDSTEPGGTDGGFDDPTAPSWPTPQPADETQPVPTPEPTRPIATEPPAPAGPPVAPLSPYAAPQPGQAPAAADPWGGQQPAAGPPAYPPPYQQPYGQAPYAQAPYDEPAYGQTPYGQVPYAQTPYGESPYGQSPYAAPPVPYAPPQQNGGALALTIVSAIASVLCCLLCVPALIFGIVALSKQSTDPAGSARMTRYGWIALGVTVALGVVLIVGFFALGLAGAFDSSGTTVYDGL